MGTCTCAAATRATETSGALGLNNLPLPNKRLKQTPRVGGIELFISAALLSRAPLGRAPPRRQYFCRCSWESSKLVIMQGESMRVVGFERRRPNLRLELPPPGK